MQRFIGIVHKDEHGNFGICFPDFLGCIAVAENMNNLIKQGRIALQAHINLMAEYGEILPKSATGLDEIMNGDLIKDSCLITDICVRLPSISAVVTNNNCGIKNKRIRLFQPLHHRSNLIVKKRLNQTHMVIKKRA